MSTALTRPKEDHDTWSSILSYGRLGVKIASLASSAGFIAATNGTKFSLSLARGLTMYAVSLSSSVAEQALLGSVLGSDKVVNLALSKSFDLVQALILSPLHIGQAVTETSLAVASSTIGAISILLGAPVDPNSRYEFNLSYKYQPKDASEANGPFPSTSHSFTHAIPSLIRILKHEWQYPQDAEQLPAESYSALSIARAVVAWASIQSVTRLYHEKKWFSSMKEIADWEWRGKSNPQIPLHLSKQLKSSPEETPPKRSASVQVISDVHLPDHGGEILTAEIGTPSTLPANPQRPQITNSQQASTQVPLSYPQLRLALRRYSHLVLGGYGGAGMVFFGIQLPSSRMSRDGSGNISGKFDGAGSMFGLDFTAPRRNSEKHGSDGSQSLPMPLPEGTSPALHFDLNLATNKNQNTPEASILPQSLIEHDETKTLTDVVRGAEEDEVREAWPVTNSPPAEENISPSNSTSELPAYSWWNLIRGKHDKEIFEAFATHGAATPPSRTSPLPSMPNLSSPKSTSPPLVHAGIAEKIPRFWVLTDHSRKQVTLVLRGTMTLNEVAIDLACANVPFSPAKTAGQEDVRNFSEEGQQGGLPCSEYRVHEGMYELAKTMGLPGKPVHQVVADSLASNDGYDLVLCGHSLGAGVCSVLGLMWTDPSTCLTVMSSGLPVGRRVSVFNFAPPCVMTPALSRLSASFITSFAYSHDVITRLSLGSVRDLKRATSWLCYGQNNDQQGETCSNIISRALVLEKGFGFVGLQGEREIEEAWFLSLRKTLEANMTKADLFPPGRVIWAMRDGDFHPSNRRTPPTASPNMPRLFEVTKVEDIFGQIIFSRDMISSHFVQNYDRVLQRFL